MKTMLFVIIFILAFPFFVFATGNIDNANSVLFANIDLPEGYSIVDIPSYVEKLWLIRGNNFNPNDSNCAFLPGYTMRVKNSNSSVFINIFVGKIEDANLRLKAIGHMVKERFGGYTSGSFLSNQIGEMVLTSGWHHPSGKFPSPTNISSTADEAMAIFSRGSYLYWLRFSSTNRIIFSFAESAIKKLDNKVTAKIAIEGLSINLPQLISQKGILNSISVKLRSFEQKYSAGSYREALNEINALKNELDAQRGKHIPEAAYQTLKVYADTIIQSLDSLMQR